MRRAERVVVERELARHATARSCAPARRPPRAAGRASPDPPWCSTSRTTLRLLRPHVRKPGTERVAFPAGGSTMTTSAPASASSSVATGPAIPSDRSTIRMSCRIPGLVPVVMAVEASTASVDPAAERVCRAILSTWSRFGTAGGHTTAASCSHEEEKVMGEYQYVTYETLDEGTIARIMLNRPESRNAQSRKLLVDLNDAFLEAEADDQVRVVILGGTGPLFSSGHDMGSKQQTRGDVRARTRTSRPSTNGGTRKGAEKLHAPGVALLLREHEALARPAQDHDRPGARHRLRGRAHAHVGVRPDRRGRERPLRRRRRHPARHVRPRVLRAPVGVRAAQDEGAHAHRRRDRRRRGAPPRDGQQGLPRRRARRPHARVRTPDRRAAHDDRAADQGVGEPERRQHGLPERARGVLHHPPAQPLALGRGAWRHLPGGMPEDGIESWKDAPPVVLAAKDEVRTSA